MELYRKRCFDTFYPSDDQLFIIIDNHDKILYYYIVDFDLNGVQTNLYKIDTIQPKTEENKLVSKKLIILNNVLSDHKNLVKVVDKEYTADISKDEYDVIG